MITLDASVLIAHLYPDDRHHEVATECLRSVTDERLAIHSLNLAEVLVGGAGAGRAEEMFADVTAIGVEVAERREGEALRLASLRAGSGLKLPDCCALEVALAAGAGDSVLASFDTALAGAARHHGLTVAPQVDR